MKNIAITLILLMVITGFGCENPLEEENLELIQRIETVRDSLKNAQYDVVSASMKNERLAQEMEVTKKNYNDLIIDLNSIQDTFISIENRARQQGELQASLVEVYRELAKGGDVGMKSSLVDDIKRQLNAVHNINLQAIRKLNEMSDEIVSKGFEIQALQSLVDDLQTQIKIKEKKIVDFQDKVNSLEQKVRAMNAYLTTTEAEWASEKAEKEAKIVELTRELENQQNINAEHKIKIEEVKNENLELARQNEILDDSLFQERISTAFLETRLAELSEMPYFIPTCAKAHYLFDTKANLERAGVIKIKKNGKIKVNEKIAMQYAEAFNLEYIDKLYAENGRIRQVVYPEKIGKEIIVNESSITFTDKKTMEKKRLVIGIVEKYDSGELETNNSSPPF